MRQFIGIETLNDAVRPDLPTIVRRCGFGVHAIRKTDLSPLEGRNGIIWPDNDKTGARCARDAAGALRKAGAASSGTLPLDSVTLRYVTDETRAPYVT